MHAPGIKRFRTALIRRAAGSVPNISTWTIPVMTSAIGGQPGTLITGLSDLSCGSAWHWSDSGFAAWMQPFEAQLPHATIAAALPPLPSGSLGRLPPMQQYTPSSFSRHRAFDQQEVLALIVRHCVVKRLFSLVSRGGLQRFGVVERELVEDDVGDDRVRRADERFAAAGAFLKMEPDDGGPRLRFQGLDNT